MQIAGANLAANFDYANLLLRRLRHVPGVVDARIQQSPALPVLDIDVDRTRARVLTGLTERDITNSLVVNFAGNGEAAGQNPRQLRVRGGADGFQGACDGDLRR